MKKMISEKTTLLMPYDEAVEKLGVPPEYFLTSLSCRGGGILRLMKKESFSLEPENSVNSHPLKRNGRLVFMGAEEIKKRLGVTLDKPMFTLCIKDGEGLIREYHSKLPFFILTMLNKELFLEICQRDWRFRNRDSEFIEMDW